VRIDPGSLLVRRWPGNGRAASYRGFDGSAAWPDELVLTIDRSDGLAEIEQWPMFDAIARAHRGTLPYDAVIVAHAHSVVATPAGVECFGYDFGWYDDEHSYFSSIRNEAMRSSPDLWRDGFNQFGLLATLADVDRYAEMRETLRHERRDIELAGPDQYAIMVFGRPL
jgi:hypothetical protein